MVTAVSNILVPKQLSIDIIIVVKYSFIYYPNKPTNTINSIIYPSEGLLILNSLGITFGRLLIPLNKINVLF